MAGTAPTNALSKFTAQIEIKDGAPVVTCSPAINGEGVREGVRTYHVWSKANLFFDRSKRRKRIRSQRLDPVPDP